MTPAVHPDVARWLNCRHIATVLFGPDANLQSSLALLMVDALDKESRSKRRRAIVRDLGRDYAERPLTHREQYGNKRHAA